jgi:bacteriocin-like protein
MKKVKLNKEELSKIEGGSGQCFGETELFLET